MKVIARVEGSRRGWEVGRPGVARHIAVACPVHRDSVTLVLDTAAQEGGVGQGCARGVHFDHKDVRLRAPIAGIAIAVGAASYVEGSCRGGEVVGLGRARHVGAASPVYGDGVALVPVTAAQEGGVGQGRAGGVHFDHKGVAVATAIIGIEGTRRGGEVGELGRARHVGVACSVHDDGPSFVPVTATQEGGIKQSVWVILGGRGGRRERGREGEGRFDVSAIYLGPGRHQVQGRTVMSYGL